jgi:hypothetical protein
MSHVTLEPMLFVKMIAEGNTIVIGDTLEIDRVCRVNLNFSQEDCMAMDDGNHSDVQVKDLKKTQLSNKNHLTKIQLFRKLYKSTKTLSIIIKD